MSATVLQVLDATIVNVALPTIQGNLGANFDEGAWIVTGYIIAAVIVIPLTPWLQRLMGRRNYYVAAIVASRSPRRSAARPARWNSSSSTASCKACAAAA